MVEIKKLNPKESCIPHDVRAKVIQIFPLNFAADLTKVYYHSIEMCDYPSEIKIANVKKLLKKEKIQSK